MNPLTLNYDISLLAPVVTPASTPTNESYDCKTDYDAAIIPALTWSDNCGNTGTYSISSGSLPAWAGCTDETFNIVLESTDACSNALTLNYDISVSAPVVTPASTPSNESYDCKDDYDAATIPALTWTDNCGNSGVYSIASGGLPPWAGCTDETFNIVLESTDACTNVLSLSYDISLSAPTVTEATPPANQTYDCESDYLSASIPVLAWSDNCGNSGIYAIASGSLPSWTGCTDETFNVDLEATDACGNALVTTITIDVKAPIVDAPADQPLVSFDCVDEYNSYVPVELSWSDNCGNGGNFSLVPASKPTLNGCNEENLVFSFQASDECGNVLEYTQPVTVLTVTNSWTTFPLPANQSIDCSDVSNFLANLPVLNYSNNASGVCLSSDVATPSNDYNTSLSCGDSFEVTWELPDGCGTGSTLHTITVTLIDNDAPDFDIPGDITIDCGDDYTNASFTGGDAFNLSDNCDTNPLEEAPQFVDITPAGSCDKRYNKIFTVTDACGYTSTKTQIITISSSGTASWENTPDAQISIECIADLPALQNLSYSGGCATPQTIVPQENTSGFANGRCGVIVRTWTPPNVCGVPSPFIQTIYIEPTIPPVFIDAPADVTLDCGETAANAPNLVLVLSCNDNVVVTPSLVASGNELRYTWSYNGVCNADDATYTQTITVPEDISFVLQAPLEICEGEVIQVSDLEFYDNTFANDLSVQFYTNPARTTSFTSLTVDAETTIYARITNALGCFEDDELTIGVIPQVSAGNDVSKQYCGQEIVDLKSLLTAGAAPGGSFSDINGNFAAITNGIADLSSLSAGTYLLRYSVDGNQGCAGDEADISIVILGRPQIAVTSKECAVDLLTYSFDVKLTGNFSSLEASVGTITNLGGGNYRISGVSKDSDVILTAKGSLTGCDATQTVVKPNCSCPVISDPVPVANNTFVCLNTANPTLEVSGIEAGNKAVWYSDAGLTNKLFEGNTYVPGQTTVGIHEFFVVQEAPGNCVSNAVKVSFEIKPLPVVNPVRLEICDDDTDGKNKFNLTLRRSAINAVPTNTVSYYTNLQDAKDGLNFIIDSMAFVNTIADSQVIFTRTVNVNNCVNTGEFKLIVNKIPVISLDITDVSCLGGNDGKVEITLNNTVSTPQFRLSNTPFSASQTYTQLSAGTDTVFVRTAKGCLASEPFSIKDGIQLSATRVDYSCNDGGTKTLPGDDIATIKLIITGGTGKYKVSENGNFIGEFDYDVEVSLPGRPANGSSGSLVIEDKILGCPITVAYGPLDPCSSDCTINANISTGVCDNGGTKTNPLDDKINFTLTATSQNGGAIAKVSIDGGAAKDYVYGSVMNISLPADGNTHTIKLVDILKPACITEIVTAPLISCSDECVIVDNSPLAVCKDNGTDSDPADDVFDAIIKIAAQNSSSLTYTIEGFNGTYEYGKEYNLGTFKIADGDKSFKITDGNSKCAQTIKIKAPQACSSTCRLSIENFAEVCNKNGTPTNPADDSYEVSFTVKQVNGSTMGFDIYLDGVLLRSGEYGKKVSLQIPADLKSHQIRMIDKADANCSLDQNTAILTPCSDECVIVDQSPLATCKDNGTDTDAGDDTFDAIIKISAQNSSSLTYTIEGISGTFEYGKEYNLGTFKITDGDKTFNIVDGNTKCAKSIKIKAPKSCSSTCKLSIENFASACNNTNTPLDPNDDTYDISFTIKQVNGSVLGFDIFVDGNAFASGEYNKKVNFKLPADGKSHQIRVVDKADDNCSLEQVTGVLTSCSKDCKITAIIEVSPCDNGGTFANITSDDTYSVTIKPQGVNTESETWTFVLEGTTYSGKFGESVIIQGLKIDDGNKTFNINVTGGNSCPTDFTILAPPSCSNPCDIEVSDLTIGECSNNNTGPNTTDDLFGISFKVGGTEQGLTRFLVTIAGKTYGPFEYNKIVTIDSLPANSSNILVSLRDTSAEKSFCTKSFTVTKAPCSSCSGMVDAGSSQNITCAAPEVTLTASSNGAIEYIWNGPGIINRKSTSIKVTNPGTYLVNAVFAFGCQAVDSIVVGKDANIPTVNAGDDKILNCEVLNTSLVASSPNSGASISFEWQNSAGTVLGTGTTLDNVTQGGIYTIKISDASTGCTSFDQVEVLKYDHVPVAAIVADPSNIIDCKIKNIVLTAGIEENSIYLWDTGNQDMIENDKINVDQPGMVRLVVIDTLSKCQSDANMMINDGESYPLIEIKSPDPLTCKTFEVTLDGSNSMNGNNISYVWTDSLGNVVGNGLRVNVTQSGTYVLTGEDKTNGCINSKSVTVNDIGERFDFNLLTKDVEVKCNDKTTTLKLQVEGSASDYNIVWTTDQLSNIIDQSNPLEPKINGTGKYFVSIINKKNECEARATANIFTPVDLPKITSVEITNETCAEDVNGTINLTGVEGGTLPYVVKINGNVVGTTYQTNLRPGSYMIQVQDQKGCEADSLVKILSGNDIKIDMPISLSVDVGEEIILRAEVNVADTLIKDYYWSPADLVDCVNCFETRSLVLSDNDYVFTVIDINGCMQEQTTEVRVRLVPKIYVPNVISLSSGENGGMKLSTEYVKNIKDFRVFDRWGNLVYHKENIAPNQASESWRGNTMGGQTVASGVYAYRIVAELTTPYIDKNGDTVTEVIQLGDVTVLR